MVRAYRDDHKLALVTANNGLRSCLRTLRLEGEVSQRLKRLPTIVDKLRREPTMKLSQMHDIGGCRVVLESAAEVEAVKTRFLTWIHRCGEAVCVGASTGKAS